MTGRLSKNFHGVGIGPLSNILAVKSPGSFGNSTLFLKRSQYISLDFYVLRKTQKAKCGS